MDAIMVAMVAVLLANADGRSGRLLALLLADRTDTRRALTFFFGSFLVNAAFSALAGTIADRMIGQGVLTLFVAFALISAAIGLLWRGPLMLAVDPIADAGPMRLAATLFLSQFGDRSQFLIAALAATAGAGLWAAAGGFVGWAIALMPFVAFGPALADQRAARWTRWACAAVLAFWGLRSAMTAFGM